MNAVGDVGDGNVFFFLFRPEEIPHLAGYLPMQFGDTIGLLR